ncbi:Dehydrodolichyl diphosphate synthase 2 [Sesamum alatum]|uniref:Alkyl transferase n=1 Tax=Sesamum alatum TaxID=300844 RepID=A0AAE1Z3U0_9LAMI|nr:Dehydrodolichyl diphosphate synthase 2 [Sesamum alatum]
MNLVEEKTKCNKGLHLIIAMNYSGRYDILQATRRIARKFKDGIIVGDEDEIDENVMENELQTNCAEFPCPDLVIRTSGEQRLSNFMLWQLAYSELFFSNKNFPDFSEQDYVDALVWFQKRNRRFGGV